MWVGTYSTIYLYIIIGTYTYQGIFVGQGKVKVLGYFSPLLRCFNTRHHSKCAHKGQSGRYRYFSIKTIQVVEFISS